MFLFSGSLNTMAISIFTWFNQLQYTARFFSPHLFIPPHVLNFSTELKVYTEHTNTAGHIFLFFFTADLSDQGCPELSVSHWSYSFSVVPPGPVGPCPLSAKARIHWTSSPVTLSQSPHLPVLLLSCLSPVLSLSCTGLVHLPSYLAPGLPS